MRFRATIAAGIVTAAAGVACTTAPAALAATPAQHCAIVGAPAPGPNAASPILGQGCFATVAEATAFAQSTVAAHAAMSPSLSFAPATEYNLGTAWSGENLTGNSYGFYGNNTCHGYYFSFSNLTGPFDSEVSDVISGADCNNAYWHTAGNFTGRQWDCYSNTGCKSRMPAGDDGAGHSVRWRA